MSTHIKNHNGFGLSIVWSLGKAMRSEGMKREVRAGRYYIDFGAADIGRGIEIDGAAYHQDVVQAFDRDSYLYQRGWKIMHIAAVKLWSDPERVQRDVLKFLFD